VVARLRDVAGAVGATGDVGAVPLLHSLCQVRWGGDGGGMEERRENLEV